MHIRVIGGNMLRIFCSLIITVMVFSAPVDVLAFAGLTKYLPEIIKKFSKSAPKQADELPSFKSSPKSVDEGLGLNGPLISKSLARASHNKTCPAMKLRVSLPQLNVQITVPNNLNIRSGPGTNYQRQARFGKAGAYRVDLLGTKGCWVRFRYKGGGSLKKIGWVYSKLLRFEFDNHLTKPQNRLIRNLGADGVYALVARSTYKIETPAGQGTAVATSPTILLTNCHVVGGYSQVRIMENGYGYRAVLIHDDYSKDKCFIRSLELEVRPVANVKSFAKIFKGDPAYSIGAPLGFNRSFGKGIVFQGQQRGGDRWVLATTPVDHGSSGGGLFDDKGNLIAITTQKTTINNKFAYSSSIVAEDFWK
jgi:S1-C subfamily serine protease